PMINTSTSNRIDETNIGLTAALQRWSEVRKAVRGRLFRSSTLAWFYVTAACATGAYLVAAMNTLLELITGETLSGDVFTSPLTGQLATAVFGAYVTAAIITLVLYLFVVALIHDWLPQGFQALGMALPGIGPSYSSCSAGAAWASMYLSSQKGETLANAFRAVANNVSSPAMQSWAKNSAVALDSGIRPEIVLEQMPLGDGSEQAVAVFLSQRSNDPPLHQVCHRASVICHDLAAQRSIRAAQIINLVTILLSAGLASFALLSVFYATYEVMEAYLFWW
ncbi:MAG: type II secretion system F family protein, partial [Planctomycetota bacterium]